MLRRLVLDALVLLRDGVLDVRLDLVARLIAI